MKKSSLLFVMFMVAVVCLPSLASSLAPRTVATDGNVKRADTPKLAATPIPSVKSTEARKNSQRTGSSALVLPNPMLAPISGASSTGLVTGRSVSRWDEHGTKFLVSPNIDVRSRQQTALAVGDVVDFVAALSSAGNYIRHMQADITEDNAGNGNPDNPPDPNDGGWDWSVVSPPAPFFHTTAASPKNLYGVSALGAYYAYLKNNAANLLITMSDAANTMVADTGIRSADDVIFLMLYDDLPAVPGNTYRDAAKAKYDARITKYGSATAMAQNIRDVRGASYPDGIIGWDIGAWVKAAAFLSARYGNSPHNYGQDAKDMAEVLWQDSYNHNPGYFDIVADAGWDPTWSNVNYWYYSLGISGLIDAFVSSGIHTAELPDLIARIKASQFSSGAVSGSYGAHANDEDWQSTAYAAMSLAYYNQSAYQTQINHMGYWTAATQDASGGWKYSDNSHYPEIGAENAAALYLAQPPAVVIVDSAFASQTDVDTYNAANSTSYLFGYDAFQTIQNGIDGVATGGQILVDPGTYVENVLVNKGVSLTGSGQASCKLLPALSAPNPGGGSLPPGASNLILVQADNVTIAGMTLDGDNPALTSGIVVGGADLDARNGIIIDFHAGVFNNLTVHDVTVRNIYLRGIYASSGGTFNFHNNTVSNVQADPASIGMFNYGGSGSMASNTVSSCGDAISSNWSTGTKYLNNTITNSGSGVHTDNNGGDGGFADTLNGNIVSNSSANGYGVWVFFPYFTPVVENNTVTNVDVGLLAWGTGSDTGTAKFSNNIVDGQSRAGSVGAWVTTGSVSVWGYASNAHTSFTGNTLKNTDYGFYSEKLDTFNTIAAANNNYIIGNGLGLSNSGAALNVQNNVFGNTSNANDNKSGNYYNANCWSDYNGSGPYPIGGGGGNTDANPGVDCGLNMTPDNILYLCGGNFTFTVRAGNIVNDLEAAELRFEYPAELAVVTVTNASSNFFSSFTQTAHAAGQKDTLTVQLAVLSGSLNGPADLFTVTMNGSTVCSPSQIAMIYRDLRNSLNAQITVPLAAPTAFKSDCIDPTVVVNSPASGGYYNTAPVLSITAGDNCGLSALYYQIDGCSPAWQTIATGLSGASYSNGSWTLPGFASLAEGTHYLRLKVLDVNTRGNSDSCSTTWKFKKDTQAPAPPTNFVAKPGFNNVKLSWTNSSSGDIKGVRIQRVPWTHYPNYGSQPTLTPPPAYPASYAAGTNVFDSSAAASAAVNHKDISGLSNATRDIYYYAAFAYDSAGNYSAAAVSAEDRATSYWLGDFTDNTFSPTSFDGYVYVQDLAVFSVAYGTKQGDAAFNANCDIGPTAGGSPKGIPMPDDSIQFEDLVIFAINFDAVSPSARIVPLFAQQQVTGQLALSLSPETVNGSTVYHLSLSNNRGDLKAVRAVLQFGDGTKFQGAEVSDRLSGSQDPVFSKVLTSGNTVTLDAAILGTGVTIGGSGELATFRFTAADGVTPTVKLVEGDMRDGNNQPLALSLSSSGSTSLPKAYGLSQNYPNPFNPTTQISYDLPSAGHARIQVFNLLGQRVAVLVDAQLEAGTHTVQWNGRDASGNSVASGIYFYRLTINDFSATRKMLLMK